jgi:lambda family phage tail tape measure protein
MADLKTQLEIGVDGSSVEAGVNKIKQSIGSLGGAAEAAGKQGAAGLDKLGAAGDQTSKKLDQATKNLIANAQRNLAAIEAGVEANGRMSGRFIESLGRQRGADLNVLKPYIQQLDQAIAKQKIALGQNSQLLQRGPALTTSLGATGFSKPLPADLGTSLGATAFGAIPAAAGKAAAAVSDFNRTFGAAGLTAKQTTAALRQVPAQMTDIFVSLQGGQAPLTVLLQQGGQLKDVFGGIGPAARALGGYVVGLINPFTLAAAAAAALAVAYNQGSKEADAYAKALILTGNAAGSNVNQLTAMSRAIAEVTGTQSQAADAVAQFAANGNIAATSIERFARVAVQLERTAGQAVGETVKQFSELGKEPLQASIKLNETTRFLTTSLYQQIKALEDQGRTAEAAAAAQRGFADAMESRTGQLEARLGSIERAWRAVKDSAAEAWSAMLNVGRAGTLDERLEQARSDLQTLEAANQAARTRGGTPTEAFQARLEQQRQLIYGLTESTRLEAKASALQADGVRQTKARIGFDEIARRNQQDKTALLTKEIELIKNAGKAAGASQAEIDKAIAGARERFKSTAAKGPRDTQRGIDRSDLAFDLSQIKSEADELVRVYADAERIIEALRSSGLVKDKDYYESRRQFLELETQAKDAALQKEIARLQQEQGLIDARKAKDPTDTAQKARDSIDNTRKIAEAESQLAILRARNSSRAVILDIEETRVAKEKTDALLSARQAAEAYFGSQNRQQNRTLEAFGQGPREQIFTQGVNQIDDNFAQQERELQNLKVLGKLTQEEYDARLAIIREFQARSIQSFTQYYDRLIDLQGNAFMGASRAVKTYIDEVANVAQTTDTFVSNSLRGLEDGLTDFLTTGKFKYKEFATSIVADVNRIIIRQQIANALAGKMGAGSSGGSDILGTLFGALMGSGGGMSSGAFGIGVSGFAMGGQVERGRLVEVNETDGPGELFNVGNRQYLLASQSGRIEPQKASSSPKEQALTVINNFMLSSRHDSSTQAQIAKTAGMGVQRALARNG